MEKRERVLLIVLCLAAVGAGVYYGYNYFWGNYVEWGKEIEQNVQRIEEAQRKAAQIEQLVEEVKVTTRELKEARRQLPQEGEFYTLLSNLESQARDAGIPDARVWSARCRSRLNSKKSGSSRRSICSGGSKTWNG